jgi:hypothetical protein
VFDGETDQVITAVLRPGNTHASHGALAILKRIVGRLHEAWPEVQIESRADAGFAMPEVCEYCEKEGIGCTIGLISNPRLEGRRAEHEDHVWSYDFAMDRTKDGRTLKMMPIVDEYSMECLSK